MRKLSLVALFLVFTLALMGCGKTDPKIVAEAFLTALQQQNYTEAYKCMGGRMVVSQDEFVEFAKEEAKEKGKIVSYELGTPEQNGSLFALIPVTMVWEKDGKQLKETFELPIVMYQGEWQVSKYDEDVKKK